MNTSNLEPRSGEAIDNICKMVRPADPTSTNKISSYIWDVISLVNQLARELDDPKPSY